MSMHPFRPSAFLNPFWLLASVAAVALCSPTASNAAETETVPGVTVQTEEPEPWITPTVNLRARYEYGDTAGRYSGHAETIRGRLGLLTRAVSGFQAFAEYEGTLAADRNSYQAASVHGLGLRRTIIADPESHELNQLWISYNGFEGVDAKAGRQEINLDNQRYVGAIAWRQNEQTFDAATFSLTPSEDLTLFYGYISKVNRIFGSDHKTLAGQRDFEGNSHLFNVAYTGSSLGRITAYAYLFDLHNDTGDTNSNQSFGGTMSGATPIDSLSYFLEYAYQTEAFDSPLNYDTHYAHAKLTAQVCESAAIDLGYEFLGSDDSVGYNFPVGTNHAFNGFADNFLTTPANGLQDLYVDLGAKLPYGLKGKIFYHKFYNDDGSMDYGDEADLVVSKDLGNGFSTLFKFARYWGEDAPFTDSTRFSIEVDYKF